MLELKDVCGYLVAHGRPDMAALVAEQRGRAERAEGKIRGLEFWLQTALDTRLVHRGHADPSGHPHGGAVAEIPEWDLRRHLDECREAITAALGEPAEKPSMDLRVSPEWLLKASENDDGIYSVGGLAVDLGLYTKPAADAGEEGK